MGVWGWQLACLRSVKEPHNSQPKLTCMFSWAVNLMQRLTRGWLPVQAGNATRSAFPIKLRSFFSRLWQEAERTGHVEVPGKLTARLGQKGMAGSAGIHPYFNSGAVLPHSCFGDSFSP